MSTPLKTTHDAEARRAKRKPVRTLAQIVCDEKMQSLDCTVLDMSGTGARLSLNNVVRKAFVPDVIVPELFRLVMPRDNIGVDCRLAWRKDHMLGVAFLSAFKPLKTR